MTTTTTRLPIDPKIRQRRIEIKRRQGRRRLLVLIAAMSVVILSAGAYGLTRSPLMDLDHLVVTAGPHTPAAAVTAAAGVPRHRLLVDIDTAAVARRLQALPWVRSADVRKKWPATLMISIVERTPAAAAAAASGGWALLDISGRVLASVPAPPPDLPAVVDVPGVGAPGSEVGAATRSVLAVAAALPPALVPKVAGVGPAPGGEVLLHLRPVGMARLGPPSDLAAKLTSLAVLLDHVPLTGPNGAVAVIDVRVPTAPVVARSLTPPVSAR